MVSGRPRGGGLSGEPLSPAEQRKAAAIARGLWLDEDRRLTIVDVAAILRVSTQTVHKMRELGQLSFKQIGGRWTISRAAFDRDLDALG